MAPDYITSDLVVAPESMEVLDSEIALDYVHAPYSVDMVPNSVDTPLLQKNDLPRLFKIPPRRVGASTTSVNGIN